MVLKKSSALGAAREPELTATLLAPRHWPSWLLVLLLSLFALLPRRWRNRLAAILGGWLYRHKAKRRCFVLTNLRRCFPQKTEAEREHLAQAHFCSSAQVMLDMPTLWWSSKTRFLRRVTLQGVEHIEAAQAQGKGVILLTCHSLALEYGGVRIGLNAPLVSIFKPFKNRLLNWLVYRARSRFGVRLAARADGLRPLIKATREGAFFYYIPDEDLGGEQSRFAPFFATEKATLPMLGRLSKGCNALVLPCYSYYLPTEGRYQVTVLPPLQDFPTGNKQDDCERMNRAIEALVEIAPEQYMWGMRLFKTQPEGQPYPYEEC
ncbi:MAG: lipid A biosynthesis acyltransferase [Gammaproteobacteria bacterium]|nr:lipid A biosynthesis acyltransferase [Gammaproteobacteria bacterium]